MADPKNTFTDANLTDKQRKRLGLGPAQDPNAKSLVTRIGEKAKDIQQATRASSQIVDPQGNLTLKEPDIARQRLAVLDEREGTVAGEGVINREPDPAALRDTFLGQQGIGPAATGQDPTQFNANPALRGATIRGEQGGADTTAIRTPELFQGASARIGGDTPQARLGQELLTNTKQVNLGSFGTEGGPDIFGRASEPGGRINTFTGAGVGDPNDPSTVVGPEAQRLGGRLSQGLQSSGIGGGLDFKTVDPSLQPGIDAFNQRAASGGSLRAGNQQFRGGAASGGGDATLRQINRINSRADKAFQNALNQGMNTKAAARIADSIRDGAGQINFQDRTRSTERNTQNVVQGQRDTAALREQGEQNRLFSTQAREDREAQVQLFRDQITKPVFNAEGVQIGEKADDAAFSRIAAQIGGPEKIGRLSPQAAQTIISRGEAITGILGNVNKIFKDNGSNQKFNNAADLVRGSKIQGKVSQTPVDFMDVISSGNVNIFDIRDDKVTIGDQIITVGDFFGDEQFSELDLAAFIEMVGVADEEE